jgi:hypothetical protein
VNTAWVFEIEGRLLFLLQQVFNFRLHRPVGVVGFGVAASRVDVGNDPLAVDEEAGAGPLPLAGVPSSFSPARASFVRIRFTNWP